MCLVAVALLAFAGCAAPGTYPPDNRPSSYLPHDEHGGPGQQVASARLSAPIEYVDNRPVVRITVGDAPGGHTWTSFRCVLDTGSSDLVIPLTLIDKAVAAYGAFSDWDIKMIGAGQAQLAGGATMKVVNAVLREVTVGPWVLHNVPVTVTRDGDCLLGMSVLKQFGHPMIDFANQRLILEN